MDEIILQSARYSEISNFLRKGALSYEKAHVTMNRIRAALLEILREIEEIGLVEELEKEKSKHTVKKEQLECAEELMMRKKRWTEMGTNPKQCVAMCPDVRRLFEPWELGSEEEDNNQLWMNLFGIKLQPFHLVQACSRATVST